MALKSNGTNANLWCPEWKMGSIPLTFFAWVQASSTSNGNDCEVFSYGGTGTSDDRISIRQNNTNWGMDYSNAASNGNNTGGSVTTSWSTLAVLWPSLIDTNLYKGYVNGVSTIGVATVTPGTSPLTGGTAMALRVLGNARSARDQAGLSAAHIAIWRAQLSASELLLLTKGGANGAGLSPLLVRRDALIEYWPLDNNSTRHDGMVQGYVLRPETSGSGPTYVASPANLVERLPIERSTILTV